MTNPIKIYYCKALKQTNKPIVVEMDGLRLFRNSISLKNVDIKMKFHNAKGAAKASGATTILEVFRR